jgi:hypothetical protein
MYMFSNPRRFQGVSQGTKFLGLFRLYAKIVFNPDSKIEAQAKEVVSGGLPVSPFPCNGWTMTRRPYSGPLNRDNGKNEEACEEE